MAAGEKINYPFRSLVFFSILLWVLLMWRLYIYGKIFGFKIHENNAILL